MARRRLAGLGTGEAELAAVTARAAQAVADAVAEAKAAGPADPAQAFTDVWADGGYQWRT